MANAGDDRLAGIGSGTGFSLSQRGQSTRARQMQQEQPPHRRGPAPASTTSTKRPRRGGGVDPGGYSSASATIRAADKKKRRGIEDDESGSIAEPDVAMPPNEARDNGNPPPSWEEMLARLAAYRERMGNTLVPKRFVDDPRLGTWVDTQRVQYKRLERRLDESTGEFRVQPNERLTADRLEKLEAIGFAWSGQRRMRDSSRAQGPSPAPSSAEETGCESSSTAGKKPEAKHPTEWEPMIQRLAAFRQCHGHCLVPKGHPEDPILANWVERVRALGRKEAESSDRLRVSGGQARDTGGTETSLSNAASSTEPGAPEATVVSTVEENCPVEPDNDALRLTAERKETLNAMDFVWDLRAKRINDHWDDMYSQLCEFRDQHGDCLVPSRYENSKLAKWVETQRYEYSKLNRSPKELRDGSSSAPEAGKTRDTRLTEDRIHRLNQIGFHWRVANKMKRFYDKQWDEMFDRLREYKLLHGHCLVPKRHSADQKLGTWVHTQRVHYRKSLKSFDASKSISVDVLPGAASDSDVSNAAKGAHGKEEDVEDPLTAERRLRLDEIGFCWSARDVDKAESKKPTSRTSYDDQWDAMFQRLADFKLKFGHSNVPKRYREDPRLGTWCDTQRVQYKRMKKKLAEAGIVYTGPSSVYGNREDSWLNNPVVGRLTDERIRRLDELGFVWSVRDDWQHHYEELKRFKAEHGHCNVPVRYETNRKLGIFVSAQRSQYKAMQGHIEANQKDNSSFRIPLTTDRIRLLNEVGFAWTVRSQHVHDENWNQRLEELKRFREAHGHCNVPARCAENPALGIWVGTQRTQYRLFMNAKIEGESADEVSSMTEDRIRRLEKLGFVWVVRGDGKLLDSFDEELGYDLVATGTDDHVYPYQDG